MATHSSILAWENLAWQATVHRVTKSRTQVKLLSTHALTQVILMIDQS